MIQLQRSLRRSARLEWKKPLFTLLAAVIFSFGIGFDAASFSGAFTALPNCSVRRAPEILQAAQSPKRTVQLTPCRFPNSTEEALCGKYEVFEDRAKKSGRKLALNLIVLPALTKTPAPDPVFFFAGGPGGSATALAKGARNGLLSQLRQHRDAVFLDQRGTGESNPLTCKLYYEDRGLQGYLPELFPLDKVRECRKQLESRADLKLYTTPIAMDDLDEVRAALGYERINLYGESYGTLAAMSYLRQHPQHVRAVSLSGVASPAMKMPLQFVRGANLAMERLIADCAADPACHGAFPNFKEEFVAVLSRFEKSPVTLKMVNPKTNQTETLTLPRGELVEQLRLMLYQLRSSSRIPLFIHEAYKGNLLPLAEAMVARAENSSAIVAMGMYLTVTCSESVWAITEADIRRETPGAFLGDYRIRRHRAACEEWVRGDVPKSFYAPLKSDAPVLMLSGEIDGATPPELVTAMQKHLPNSRQILIPNEPHNYQSRCVTTIIAEFIEKGSTKELDTACVQTNRRPPFVTK